MPPCSHVSTHVCTFTRTHVDVCGVHPHIHPHSRSHPVTLRPPAPNVRAHTPFPHPVHAHMHTHVTRTRVHSPTQRDGINSTHQLGNTTNSLKGRLFYLALPRELENFREVEQRGREITPALPSQREPPLLFLLMSFKPLFRAFRNRL